MYGIIALGTCAALNPSPLTITFYLFYVGAKLSRIARGKEEWRG